MVMNLTRLFTLVAAASLGCAMPTPEDDPFHIRGYVSLNRDGTINSTTDTTKQQVIQSPIL